MSLVPVLATLAWHLEGELASFADEARLGSSKR